MIQACYRKKILTFKRPTLTSRGILTEKPSWYIFLRDDTVHDVTGTGECSVIPGLSRETEEMTDRKIAELCTHINNKGITGQDDLTGFPSLQFGLETAMTDLMAGGNKVLFPSDFTRGKAYIRIHGLIWMGTLDYLHAQIEDKLKQGFICIKLKIGTGRTADELRLLKSIRNRYDAEEVELRVDANGAFEPGEAMEILKRLADLEVHSVEQPIRAGQWEEMAWLCRQAPVPVALDEELLWHHSAREKRSLLSALHPGYLVLKPGLLGGFQQAKEYMDIARELNIDWWINSAMESNIGLNAITQWTYTLGSQMVQGLGTGTLYRENVICPLTTEGDKIFYDAQQAWNTSIIESPI
jgi:o-succinylbenzoate synthase